MFNGRATTVKTTSAGTRRSLKFCCVEHMINFMKRLIETRQSS